MFYLILGSTTGLGLILNVEQYEYMRGPQNDAGVKVISRNCFPGRRKYASVKYDLEYVCTTFNKF